MLNVIFANLYIFVPKYSSIELTYEMDMLSVSTLYVTIIRWTFKTAILINRDMKLNSKMKKYCVE